MKKLFKFLVAVFMGFALVSCTTTESLRGVTLDKEAITLVEGETATLEATISPENLANETTIVWSTTNDKVATVNDEGVVTAVKAGTAKIKVTATRGAVRREDTCTVKVLPKVIPVTGITLDKNEGRLNVGESIKLTPTVLPDNATNKSVTWSTSDANVATVNDGLVSAIKAGNVTITVTTNDGNKNATCTITVVQPVTGVVLDKQAHTLNVGENFTLTATVNPDDAENKEVTWSSSNAAVATVNNGLVSAINAGTATITVKTADGNKEASCVVTVLQPVTGIELDAEELVLVVGEDTTLVATVLPSDASNKAVTWTSNNAAVATVNAEGKVIAVGPGSAVITATTVDGNKTSTCTVTVVEFELPATGVVIEGDKNTLVIEETLLLEAVVTPTNSTDKVTWSSSNENVATVGQNGLVTALAAGTTTIKVKFGAVEATYDITVVKHTAIVKGFEDKVVTYGSNYEFIYTVSSNQTVSLEYYKGETKLAAKPTNAGEYNVKLTLAENDKYNAFTKTVKLTINQKEVSEPTVSGSYTYNGSEQTVTLVGLESYMSVAGNKATNAGSYEVVVTLDNNHKWAQGNDGVVAWSIAKANASLSVEDLEVELGGEIEVDYETSSDGQVTIKFYQNDVEVTPDAAGEYKLVVTVAEGTNYKKAEANATLTIIVSATGVELSKESTTINVGENETIEITVSPADTTDPVVITSTDEEVATMDKNGEIVAKTKVGTTITVTCGDYSDSIEVTVVSPWGTEEEPISVEKALELTNALNSWGYSKVPGYMIGVVVDPGYNSQYKNYTMIVADLNNPAITYTFFRGVDTDPSNESIVSVGDIVVLYGYYCNYGSDNPTPEMTKNNNVTPTIISVEKPKFDIELSVKDTNGNDTTSVTVVDLEEKAEVNAKVEFTIENEQDLILIVTVNDVELTPVDGTYSFIITEATLVKVIVVEGNVNADSITIEGETTVELDDTLTLVGTTVPYFATETKTWTSSDESIATVVNGVVTPKKAGTVTITVKTGTTNKEATHEITITNRWGTLENPISVETAIELIKSEITANNIPSSVQGYLKGIVKTEATLSGADYSMYLEAGNNSFQLRYVSLQEGQLVPSVGDEVVVYGYFTKFNTTYQMSNISGYGRPNIISVAHKEYSYTVEYLDTEDAVFVGAKVVGLDSTLTSGAESVFTVEVPQGYEVNKVKFNRVTITPNAEGEYTIVTALENVITVIVAKEGSESDEPAEPAWTLVTNASDLAAGDQIVIVATDADYALSTNQKSNNRGQVEVVKGDETVTFGEDVQVLTLEAGTKANTFAFNTGSGYLFAASSSSNHLKTEATLTDNSSWLITIADGVATIKAQGTNTRNWLRYNSSSSLFACYSSGQGDVSIYKYLTNSGSEETPTCEHTNKTTTTVEATCTQKGSTTVTCVDCSEVISTTEIPMIDHADVNTDDDHDCDVCGATNITRHEYDDGVCNCGEREEVTETKSGWILTNLVDIQTTDLVVIVWTTSDGASFALTSENGSGSAPTAVSVTIADGKLNSNIKDDLKWNISNSTGNLTIYPNGTTDKWLYCTATNNGVRVGTNENKTFVIDADSGYLKNTATNRYLGVYNNQDIRCYTNTTGNTANQTLSFYKFYEGSSSEPVCEHTNKTTETVDATCTEVGSVTTKCADCGVVFGTEEVPAKGHTYVGGVCSCGEQEPQEKWTLVTDVNDLAAGDKVVIVAKDSDYALSTTQNKNNRGQAAVAKDGSTVTFGADVQVLTLEAGTVANTFAFNTGSGYLYAASASSNYLRTETTLSANSSWTIEIADDGTATIVAQGANSRKVMQYNQNSSLFACYSSASQKAVRIYKLG